MKHGTRIFFESGTSGKKLPWSYDEQLFQRWRDGKTGMPLVDANMREIKQTGVPLSFSSMLTRAFCSQCILCWCAWSQAACAEQLLRYMPCCYKSGPGVHSDEYQLCRLHVK